MYSEKPATHSSFLLREGGILLECCVYSKNWSALHVEVIELSMFMPITCVIVVDIDLVVHLSIHQTVQLNCLQKFPAIQDYVCAPGDFRMSEVLLIKYSLIQHIGVK